MGLFDFLKRKHKNRATNTASPEVISESFPSRTAEESPVVCKEVPRPSDSIVERGHVRLTCLEIDEMILSELNKSYIAFDVETTGLSSYSDRIVELGAVRFANGVAEETFTTLVNPNIPISASATAINHITNEMLAAAPSEQTVYPQLLEFLGDAAHAETILCAHNAQFDMGFLSETLIRLGIIANFRYVDTLRLSRKYLKGMPNYKQTTLADCLGISVKDAHRAADDAQVCGEILQYVMGEIKDEIEEKKRQFEKACPTEEELAVCAFIQNIIARAGEETLFIRYRRNSSNYVEASCLYPFLKFKFARKGKYIILPKQFAHHGFEVEDCTVSEGGTSNIRAYFSYLTELETIAEYIVASYREIRKSFERYINNSNRARTEAMQIINGQKALSTTEVKEIFENEKLSKEKSAANEKPRQPSATTSKITRESVEINPKHTRVPLSLIKNLGDSDKGYKQGSPYYYAGEELRKAGDLVEAIRLFDQARYHGYDAPALYEAYVKAYRQMKDYENEIELCEEGMERLDSERAGILEARRDKAVRLLYARQIAQRNKQEKAQKKEEKATANSLDPTNASNIPKKGRAILQLTDDQTIIRAFESVSEAVRETGINAKSIRDAAKGIQKHAGGFCWRYKESEVHAVD